MVCGTGNEGCNTKWQALCGYNLAVTCSSVTDRPRQGSTWQKARRNQGNGRAVGKIVLTTFWNVRRNGVCRDGRNICWSVSCGFLVSNFEYYCREPRTIRFYATYWFVPTFGVNGRQYVCCLRITIQTDRQTDSCIRVPFVYMSVQLCLILREWHRLKVSENRALRYISEPKKKDVTGDWRKTTHWKTLWFVLLTSI